MLWLLLVLPASFFIFKDMWFGHLRPDDFVTWMGYTFIGAMFTLVVAGVCCGIAGLCGLAFRSHAVEVGRSSLVAIRDKDGASGEFFLGTGLIKSDQYYFYYERQSDGGFRPGKIFAGDGVRVYEEDRVDAELVRFEWQVDSVLVFLIAFPVNSGGYSYDFHVPKGTIRTGYAM